MAVIHVFKDGTRTTELKDVYVPNDIVRSLAARLQKIEERERNEQKQKKQN